MVPGIENPDQLSTNVVLRNDPRLRKEYCYEPLNSANDSTAIRILHLEPAESEGAPIVGRLVHGSYVSSSYTAVSYVWGDPTPKHEITINGQSLLIASNIFQILKWLREPTHTLALWVDAICINQADTTERSTQVQGMAKVYGSADRVIACLGSKTPNFDLGSSFLRQLSQVSFDQALGETLDPNNLPALEAALSLLDKPYWTRLWILQEIAVNKILCLRFENDARSELALEDLMRIFAICNTLNASAQPSTFNESIFRSLSLVAFRLSPIATASSFFPFTVDELQPLLYTQMWEGPMTTDPLDCVYGLFGLFAEAPFPVDYNLSPKQLYLKVIQFVQERTGNLDFLSLAWGNYLERRRTRFENKFQLPRWGVDFSYRRAVTVPYALVGQSNESRVMIRTIYRASGIRQQKVEFASRCGDHFKASGVIASTVDHIGSVHDESVRGPMWPRDWNDLSRPMAPSAPLRSELAGAYQSDAQIWSAEGSSSCFEDLNIWWRTLICDSIGGHKRLNDSREYYALIPPRNVEAVEKLSEILAPDSAIPMHDGRRMFRTADGRLGLAPSLARVGDCVCVLFGGDVPYILRNMGDSDYEFVGDCYLHDAMDGQELARGLPEQNFTVYG